MQTPRDAREADEPWKLRDTLTPGLNTRAGCRRSITPRCTLDFVYSQEICASFVHVFMSNIIFNVRVHLQASPQGLDRYALSDGQLFDPLAAH